MAASFLPPSALPVSLAAARSLILNPLCLSSAQSTKCPQIPRPDLEDIMGSRTKDGRHAWLLQSPSESIRKPAGFLIGHIGQEAAHRGLKPGLENSFILFFLCV